MKRFFAILLATLYITLTGGIAVNVHYCMGKLAGVDLKGTPADVCNKCKKPAKGMDCCKDEVKFCKLTESHQAAKATQQNFAPLIDLQLPVKILPTPSFRVLASCFDHAHHDPPDNNAAPLFVRNCTFLI
ncbi:hypothetical protein J2T02_003432 [Chitinophaga terrae (ex Kim and Jung 2007)]|uniref:HYC_CC_PP family protein n=1 Tax=Chitinophaga terrae (ex Kim and Jung 2007) TaxID=408074 RepID=UPI002788EE6B|nr:hypothetical protein [Chitinophaga terrae (ex Kim and Jung 2007)]MDQ0108304.1 hypothetical protein [Chitinophaga terrae (ex Kim and Jung 2007)]